MWYFHQLQMVEQLRRACAAQVWIEQMRWAVGCASCVLSLVHALAPPSQRLFHPRLPSRHPRAPQDTSLNLHGTVASRLCCALGCSSSGVHAWSGWCKCARASTGLRYRRPARPAARFLEVPAAPVARPCDSWSQGAALCFEMLEGRFLCILLACN